MGHVRSRVMYIYIFNELMHHSPVINNAGPLMPFIKRCSSNIKQIFGQSFGAAEGKPELAPSDGNWEKKNQRAGSSSVKQ